MKLGLEPALEPEQARVQTLVLQERAQAQASAQVAKLERLELRAQVQLEPQVRLELEQHLQRSNPKPQLHPHRCKVPDRSREPQQAHCQTQVHPKALDMTSRVLVLALELQVAVLELAQAPELERVQGLAAQLAQKLEQPVQQELLTQELKPKPELHVFLERLPLQQDLTQHI